MEMVLVAILLGFIFSLGGPSCWWAVHHKRELWRGNAGATLYIVGLPLVVFNGSSGMWPKEGYHFVFLGSFLFFGVIFVLWMNWFVYWRPKKGGSTP